MAKSKPKGSLQFDRFKEKIVTRLDRFDPEWLTQLEYLPNTQKETSLEKKLCFENQKNIFLYQLYFLLYFFFIY